MINLSSEPSLGTLVLSKGGMLKYTYVVPRGQEFPAGTESEVVITDRAGAELGRFEAEVGETEAVFLVDPALHEQIPAGANFELFVTLPDEGPFKVRYGRVVRREAQHPLNPVQSETFDAAMYEDDLDRNSVGPRWIAKYGALGMHAETGGPPDWTMAARYSEFFLPLTLFDKAAALWYAPLRGDAAEVKFNLLPGGDGTTTIVVGSNYAMTKYVGVSFSHEGLFGNNRIAAVTGSGPLTLTQRGSTVAHTIPTGGGAYTLRWARGAGESWVLNLFVGESTSPALTWTDSTNVTSHNSANRYLGVSFQSSFLSSGPRLYYWKAKDVV